MGGGERILRRTGSEDHLTGYGNQRVLSGSIPTGVNRFPCRGALGANARHQEYHVFT
jgi:hypothetical protein